MMRQQPAWLARVALLFVTIAWAAGCGGGGDRLVHVTGTATRNGKSVPNLVITFVPDKGQRCVGLTDADGKFTLLSATGQTGAPVGTHKVWVQLNAAGSKDDADHQKRLAAQKSDPEISAILKKYGRAETTPLTVEIKESRDIALTLD